VSWEPLPSTFERARRREAYRRFARAVSGTGGGGLLPLDEVQSRLRFFEQTYVGIRSIPVAAIRGTAGRNNNFDRDFLPTRPDLRERWRRIEQAFPEGGFPPIVVYKLGESYFVVDGHHRVAIAKQRKVEFIDAEVTELRTRYELPDDADIGRIIFRQQEQMFLEESGLARARPEARIVFTKPPGFMEMLELIQKHGFHLMRERNMIIPMEDIAADFYDNVYLPTVEQIKLERLQEAFHGATEGDLFLLIWERRRSMFATQGGMTLEDTVHELGGAEARRLGNRARRAARRMREVGAAHGHRASGP
jgi:ParB/Sulfiredoxin domain